MADAADTTPTTREDTTKRFRFGRVYDVAQVLADHGYGPFGGDQYVDLNLHLLHFLHGAEGGYDRCFGDTVPADDQPLDSLDEHGEGQK